MKVQTYEQTECAAEPIDMAEEAIGLIEEMGLEGQMRMVTPPDTDTGERGIRMPYRQIKNEENFVFKTICPTEFDMKKYDKSPIPVRVLQVAAHALSLGFFEKLVVWDATTPIEKDPVLLGIHLPDPEKEYEKRYYLLARWGEELDEWPALIKRVVEIARATYKAGLEKIAQEIKVALAVADTVTFEQLSAKTSGPSTYGVI